MKALMTFLMFGALCAIPFLFGCGGLSDAQQARIDALSEQNNQLALKSKDVLERARLGIISPAEMLKLIDEIKVTLAKNRDEIKTVYEEAGTKATISGVLSGTFGRSALHFIAGLIPATHPIGGMIQGVLMLLLGGSSTVTTKKPEPAVPPPATG